MLAGILEGAYKNISIFIIYDAPTVPLLNSMDEMLGTFFLHQYIFETTVFASYSLPYISPPCPKYLPKVSSPTTSNITKQAI